MRPNISNELLLRVIQAWNPDEKNAWSVYDGGLLWGVYLLRGQTGFIRGESKGTLLCHDDAIWDEARQEIAFLLKDRPDLELCNGRCPKDTKNKSLESFEAFWDSDPWGPHTPAFSVVKRIKSYEYLREWKESQETAVNPHDVTLTIDGQAIEGMEICDDVLGVPVTYEKICPHCNGSKEVVGWLGKESCQACV